MPDTILGSNTDRALSTALTGLSTRQRLISHNLANVETPEFKASEVSFEDQLQQAMANSQRGGLTPVAHHPGHIPLEAAGIEDVRFEIAEQTDTMTRVDGNSVDIDKEMVTLAETNLTYNALVQLTTARLSLTRYIINEGRR